jgi:hypothetical protein
VVRGFDVEAIRTFMLGLPALGSDPRHGLFMMFSLPVGWVAWRVLQRLARGYARKRFSDVQLMVDCWWFIVTCLAIVTLSSRYGVGGIAVGLAALAAYRLTVWLVLHRWNPGPAASPRRLLLLRVFGYQRRTEALFDRVAQQWRFHGPVQLIAGSDLPMRTADAGDIMAFLDGRVAEQYVACQEDVDRRLHTLDCGPDPDGRFRVNELYGYHDTWRPALLGLLGASDIVLMDLRSFGPLNAGCIFEIQALMRHVPSDRIVLVGDRTTDEALLGALLGGAWSAARAEGRSRGTGEVAIVRVEHQSRREIGALMRSLLYPGEAPLVFAAPAPLSWETS